MFFDSMSVKNNDKNVKTTDKIHDRVSILKIISDTLYFNHFRRL